MKRASFSVLALLFAVCHALGVHTARAQTFLGLSPQSLRTGGDFWEGETDYRFALRPRGQIRAIMLFARFPDTTTDEATTDLYTRLAPQAIDFFARASYGKMSLRIDPLHRWIPMDHPSTWPNYSAREFHTQKTYLEEVIRKADADPRTDFSRYDIVYVVGSRAPGMPNSPTWGAPLGEGIVVGGKELRHGVTFGNDIRTDRWGWQTLCHETGHIFGLPDLYSFDYSPPYKHIQRYVGFWDLMGYQAVGSEYLAWQKRKLEWLSDDDFVIVPRNANGAVEAVVTSIYSAGGKKAVVLPISPTEAYVAEVRSRTGEPNDSLGILLYRVSLTAGHEGHIRILPAAPDDNDPARERRFITLYNALYHTGNVLNDTNAHARINIVGQEGNTFHLRVSR